ncbi:hypothetical protein ACGFSI_42410 [Streptomyces virginiae]|uniref:hypothetical protein n=1 Tax=Streptomyces virginiae TaxID=1961 RepID=UPI00372141AE
MTLHIDPVALLVLTIGLLVGRAVHKHTAAAAGAASKGDIVGAIGAAAAVITALFLLLTGGGSASTGEDSRPAGRTPISHQVSEVRSP